MKKSGILMPVTSLPSSYGIGCFSKSAYDFVDFLKKSGQSLWQILPLSPTSYGDSPYQSPSAFAGNPYFISLCRLIGENLLTKVDCEASDYGEDARFVDYEKIYKSRYPLLKKAYLNAKDSLGDDFYLFCEENADWLDDYALFMAIKEHFGQKEWLLWDEDIKLRQKDAVLKYEKECRDSITFHKFLQYRFFDEWYRLKEYANSLGISIVGDIPIYVALDSHDVWAHPELFLLDKDRTPINVAGCPPDAFSSTGQLWGNPLYRWDTHEKDGFSWWVRRLAHSFRMYDYVRIDHFRGFDEYYSIPYGSKDATVGTWEKGPGMKLFCAIENALGKKDVIAEDLGFITESVRKLVRDSGFLSMKVLEFGFDSRDSGEKGEHLAHNYPKNCVAYTATHDNQTLKSWFGDLPETEKQLVREYICDFATADDKLNYPLISVMMMSKSQICIVPIQDYLELSDCARMNTPSTVGNNWKWRLTKNDLTDTLAKRIYNLTKRYDRI